ncbi:MAG: bifunctional DNA primase/polymerase, partial [Acidaminococcaceae bacterium]|nr:bifunctional DNA primase/polymerase [Acidaminococcaceae bacterium]
MVVLETALKLAQKNKPVFPCSPENKRPLTMHGFKDASVDEGQVRQWWQQQPNAMIGMPTGSTTGIWVVDCDGEQGKVAFQELCQQHGYTPETLCQNTPSGGCHYLFACPATPVKNSVSKLALNVDVQGEGGYIIVAPSVKADGGRYVWANRTPVAAAPEWLIALVCKPEAMPTAASPSRVGVRTTFGNRNAYVETAIANECKNVACSPKGTRNQTLFQASCALFGLVASGNADENTVQAALERAATESGLANDDGLDSVLKTIESGKKAGLASPRQIPEANPKRQLVTNAVVQNSGQQEWPVPVPFDDF